jgi:hypothetical protein
MSVARMRSMETYGVDKFGTYIRHVLVQGSN